MNLSQRLLPSLQWLCVFSIVAISAFASADDSETLRVGVIGLDTSHVPAFTKELNQTPANPELRNCRVVAAYPYGSRTIESSYNRIPKFTEEVQSLGVEIVDSIDELLKRVDCVLLETNDGGPHLKQALEVFRAGKPVFIDKPTGSNLSEVVAIFKAAEHYQVPMFSASSLRYSKGAQAIRGGKVGDVLGCNTYSPCTLEPSHTDLFWYGIHGVELLYTCMGPNCQLVRHTSTQDREVVVGVWNNERIGIYYGMRKGPHGYGGTVFGDKATEPIGKYDGYQPLLLEIAKFFRTRKPPIDASETIEIYAFMQAASLSKERGGEAVMIEEVINTANQEANVLLDGQLHPNK
ncbi:Oxidoreductase family, NAD-binding Rossmann fold [Rubripirellula amarantea]|uniref:Oxidoreductase family, NAD-binding Rossmann fold n=1 Tax=Rubripirellula amarantea TaxID=2527999 RepID=A0A5C5WLW7_9BACT|nr:Gfo/Idh/MocA family oxidoreductase [Rubripirellula amarantea]TWT51129.1 Oxidoreductase family, NAD-binding Rossmann fold [Rubripirellula amarantea]